MTALDRPVILGGSGFVGRDLMDHFSCPGTSNSNREGFETVDATRLADLRPTLERLHPKVLINCVGLADVDRAEREPALAESLNHQVVENLAQLQRERPFRLVHISTDYVFDGFRGMYRESDPTGPVNEYGRSKLRGEEVALRVPTSLVVRISSPYGRGFGARKPQFFRYVTDSLREGKEVRALTDQRVTATFLPDLARAIERLVDRGAVGIVHVGSREPMTRFDFARKVATVVRADANLIRPGRLADMTQWAAKRPSDTTLDVRLSERLGVTYTPTEDALRELLST